MKTRAKDETPIVRFHLIPIFTLEHYLLYFTYLLTVKH